MSPSYQLPDLLSLCRPFELRTNRFCRPATTASESWLLELKTADAAKDLLTGTERTSLRPAKAGLLAALCVPGCGQPQLRFFANLLSLLIIADERIHRACSVSESGWMDGGGVSGVDTLGHHALFQSFVTFTVSPFSTIDICAYSLLPELRRLVSRADPTWETRFASSVHSYHSAQLQVITGRLSDVIPDLDSYLLLRRDLTGLQMMLDLIELTENLTLPPMDDETSSKLTNLKQLAADIIGCSLDVFSFNNDQAQGNRHNLITVIANDKRLSLQGALNLAGILIKQMFDSFIETEKSIFCPPTPLQSNHFGNGSLSSYWSWISSTRLATPPASLMPDPSNMADCGDLARLGDLPSYVQTLRDCIVGTINWAYETELYFGKKGEEIRTFGWVFLKPPVDGEE
ncbi:isoprenoid synthase domain-containing protein [Lyophyllum atratum]|nr:isoprenoid synthase domain-containing protein [Lyophyllum atratum]